MSQICLFIQFLGNYSEINGAVLLEVLQTWYEFVGCWSLIIV